ncbi:hypothetical protein HDV00_008917 [Rhizophlyctis rosea]|nr:hypothetical protein HDV00_008917 [Rhizophlyctis rosea]
MSRRGGGFSGTAAADGPYRALITHIATLQQKDSNKGALVNIADILSDFLPNSGSRSSASSKSKSTTSLRNRADIREALNLLVQAQVLDTHELRYRAKPGTLANGVASGSGAEDEDEFAIDGEGHFVKVERGYALRRPIEDMVKENKKQGMSPEKAIEEMVDAAIRMVEAYQQGESAREAEVYGVGRVVRKASRKDVKGKGIVKVKEEEEEGSATAPAVTAKAGSKRKGVPDQEETETEREHAPATRSTPRRTRTTTTTTEPADPIAGHTRRKGHTLAAPGDSIAGHTRRKDSTLTNIKLEELAAESLAKLSTSPRKVSTTTTTPPPKPKSTKTTTTIAKATKSPKKKDSSPPKSKQPRTPTATQKRAAEVGTGPSKSRASPPTNLSPKDLLLQSTTATPTPSRKKAKTAQTDSESDTDKPVATYWETPPTSRRSTRTSMNTPAAASVYGTPSTSYSPPEGGRGRRSGGAAAGATRSPGAKVGKKELRTRVVGTLGGPSASGSGVAGGRSGSRGRTSENVTSGGPSSSSTTTTTTPPKPRKTRPSIARSAEVSTASRKKAGGSGGRGAKVRSVTTVVEEDVMLVDEEYGGEEFEDEYVGEDGEEMEVERVVARGDEEEEEELEEEEGGGGGGSGGGGGAAARGGGGRGGVVCCYVGLGGGFWVGLGGWKYDACNCTNNVLYACWGLWYVG